MSLTLSKLRAVLAPEQLISCSSCGALVQPGRDWDRHLKFHARIERGYDQIDAETSLLAAAARQARR